MKIGLELGCCISILLEYEPSAMYPPEVSDFWTEFSNQNILLHKERIITAAQSGNTMLWLAYDNAFISPDDVVAICAPDRLFRLYRVYWYVTGGFGLTAPIFKEMTAAFAGVAEGIRLLPALGRYLMSVDAVPTIDSRDSDSLSAWFLRRHFAIHDSLETLSEAIRSDGMAYVGLLYCVALSAEAIRPPGLARNKAEQEVVAAAINDRLAPLPEFAPYVTLRLGLSSSKTLPFLAVSDLYKDFFRHWAAREVSIATGDDTPGIIDEL